MDVNRALRSAAQTGELELGFKESLDAVERGDARLAVVAANTPADLRERVADAAEDAEVPLHAYEGLNRELGSACGEPFAVSVLAVVDAGESDVLRLARDAATT